jgi:thiamine-monophosphate kinase
MRTPSTLRAMLPEDALVSAIAEAVGPPSGAVALGIGDDCAVLDDGTVASTDVLVEGVHFDLARMTARDVGHRAGTANLSDVAAMGARPLALLAAFGLPPEFEDAAELAAGMSEHGVRPGDVLAVTGPLGGQAVAGYAGRVAPRIEEGCALAAVATAMIDLSDGIATDVARLARASGTGAVVELERLPRAPGATVEQAAAGGEDYELLAALPPGAQPPVAVTVVGRLTAGPGVVLVDAAGTPRALRGWDHFG